MSLRTRILVGATICAALAGFGVPQIHAGDDARSAESPSSDLTSQAPPVAQAGPACEARTGGARGAAVEDTLARLRRQIAADPARAAAGAEVLTLNGRGHNYTAAEPAMNPAVLELEARLSR